MNTLIPRAAALAALAFLAHPALAADPPDEPHWSEGTKSHNEVFLYGECAAVVKWTARLELDLHGTRGNVGIREDADLAETCPLPVGNRIELADYVFPIHLVTYVFDDGTRMTKWYGKGAVRGVSYDETNLILVSARAIFNDRVWNYVWADDMPDLLDAMGRGQVGQVTAELAALSEEDRARFFDANRDNLERLVAEEAPELDPVMMALAEKAEARRLASDMRDAIERLRAASASGEVENITDIVADLAFVAIRADRGKALNIDAKRDFTLALADLAARGIDVAAILRQQGGERAFAARNTIGQWQKVFSLKNKLDSVRRADEGATKDFVNTALSLVPKKAPTGFHALVKVLFGEVLEYDAQGYRVATGAMKTLLWEIDSKRRGPDPRAWEPVIEEARAMERGPWDEETFTEMMQTLLPGAGSVGKLLSVF